MKSPQIVELTADQRALLRRLVRDAARRMGYGTKYHDDPAFPLGPQDWPDALRKLHRVMRKLQEKQHRDAGGMSWPDGSPQSDTPTALNVRT